MSGRIHGLNEKQRILKGWLQAVDSQLKETLQTVERFLPKIGISQLASAIALLTSVTNATKADMEDICKMLHLIDACQYGDVFLPSDIRYRLESRVSDDFR